MKRIGIYHLKAHPTRTCKVNIPLCHGKSFMSTSTPRVPLMISKESDFTSHFLKLKFPPTRNNDNGAKTSPNRKFVLQQRKFGNVTKNMEKDGICELAASNIRYGAGATAEVGMDLKELGVKHVLVVTDKNIRNLPCMEKVLDSLSDLEVTVYDNVRVEPNDVSMKNAIDFVSSHPKSSSSSRHPFDAIVALGGGSVIDTAKAANLYSCHPPSDFYDYVNPPIGRGIPPPGALLPFIAIPTTAGTGSETTGVAIFDDTPSKSKTGIGHRRLKPTLGIVDPENTETLPVEVAKYSGMDVLAHAIESYTALPFTERPMPKSPLHRPAYQGSNPISDIWSIHALQTCVKYLNRAIADPSDVEARSNMLLASTAAGIGFGNAGVHLCHGMSYPVASQVKTYRPPGYPNCDHALVPHGHSVIVTAPAVFRFTGQTACPDRHLMCAEILAKGRGQTLPQKYSDADAGAILSDELLEFMHQNNVPIGLELLGYTKADISSLVEGTLPQERVTKLSPRPVGREELEGLFLDAMSG